MEEQKNQFMTMGRIGGKQTVPVFGAHDKDDHYIRDQNIANLELLKDTDARLGEVIERGHEANVNMQEASRDLLTQKQQLLKFFYYDEELNVYIDKSTNKVAYLEKKTWTKKCLMITLAVALALICAVSLLLKLFG